MHPQFNQSSEYSVDFEIAGDFQIGDNIKPLNHESVASVVRYGQLRYPLTHEATGYSLVYNQLYPFEGLRNYTSGIIHHVRLTGMCIQLKFKVFEL